MLNENRSKQIELIRFPCFQEPVEDQANAFYPQGVTPVEGLPPVAHGDESAAAVAAAQFQPNIAPAAAFMPMAQYPFSLAGPHALATPPAGPVFHSIPNQVPFQPLPGASGVGPPHLSAGVPAITAPRHMQQIPPAQAMSAVQLAPSGLMPQNNQVAPPAASFNTTQSPNYSQNKGFRPRGSLHIGPSCFIQFTWSVSTQSVTQVPSDHHIRTTTRTELVLRPLQTRPE